MPEDEKTANIDGSVPARLIKNTLSRIGPSAGRDRLRQYRFSLSGRSHLHYSRSLYRRPDVQGDAGVSALRVADGRGRGGAGTPTQVQILTARMHRPRDSDPEMAAAWNGAKNESNSIIERVEGDQRE